MNGSAPWVHVLKKKKRAVSWLVRSVFANCLLSGKGCRAEGDNLIKTPAADGL